MISYKGSGKLYISQYQHCKYAMMGSAVYKLLRYSMYVLGDDYSDYIYVLKSPPLPLQSTLCGNLIIEDTGEYKLSIVCLDNFNVLYAMAIGSVYISPKNLLGVWLFNQWNNHR